MSEAITFPSLPDWVTAHHDDDVDTGPLWTIKVAGERVGEVYQDHDGRYIAAYLDVNDDGQLEQIEHDSRCVFLVNAVFYAMVSGVRPSTLVPS